MMNDELIDDGLPASYAGLYACFAQSQRGVCLGSSFIVCHFVLACVLKPLLSEATTGLVPVEAVIDH